MSKIKKGIVPDYISILTKLRYTISFTRFIVVCLLVTNVIMVYLNVTLARSQKVIIVPKGFSETFTIGDNYAEATYLKSMGSYVAMLLFNFNSNTVEEQYEELSKMMSYSSRVDAVRQAMEYKKNNISSKIIIREIKITDNVITITMQRVKYILDKPQKEDKVILYITYGIEYGTFKVLELEVDDEVRS